MIDNQTSVEDEPAGKNVLVFGKIDDNTFSLEFSNPISPFQAFGIAVSQFDFKLNC